MAASIEVPYKKTVHLGKPLDATLELLKNPVALVGPHFPGLESLTPLGNDLYEWKFETLKYNNFSTQIIFQTLMQLKGNTLTMTPQGNAPHSLKGSWTIAPEGQGTTLQLDFILQVELPIPRLMKSVAEPIARKELTHLFDKFTNNVQKAST